MAQGDSVRKRAEAAVMTVSRVAIPALLAATLGIAACSAPVPNDVAQGVGFQDYAAYEARRTTLHSRPVTTVTAPNTPLMASASRPVPPARIEATAATLPAPSGTPATTAPDLTAMAATAIARAEASPTGQTGPVTLTSARLPAPAASPPPAMPGEQDVQAESVRDTITSDAGRLARMQAEPVVVQPVAVPDRPATPGPGIIDYALSTTHPVGDRQHPRRPISQARHHGNCIAFRSADRAQEWFLENGGPGRDRRGLDPDGDGYACAWNPSVYRAAAAVARN